MKKIIIITIILTLCTGCIRYKELNNLSIISNITISYQDNKYHVTFQEIIPSKKEDGVKYTYEYRESSHKELNKAFKKYINHSPKTIYLKKVQNIIFNTKENNKTIKSFLNYYNHNKKEFNKHTSLVIANNNLKKILKVNSDYKYIDSILKDKQITLKNIKENKKIKIPNIKISNKELIFTKYSYLQV